MSLTGRPRGSLKTWVGDGYAWATSPPTGIGMSVGEGLSGGEFAARPKRQFLKCIHMKG